MDERALSREIAQFMPRMIRGVQFDFFARHPITQTQFFMLIAVESYGRCTMGTLARNMKIRMPTATGIIARMVSAGLVKRQSDPSDRRSVIVTVTPKGARLIAAFKVVLSDRWAAALKGLDAAELRQFHAIILKLRKYLAEAEK